MKSLKLLVVSAALTSLAACAPQGYTEAPTVSAYVSNLLPKSKRANVEKIAVCWLRGGNRSGVWYTTVAFKGGNVYHYELETDWEGPPLPDPIHLSYSNTKAQRQKAPEFSDAYVGCFSHDFHYLVEARGDSVRVYVDDDLIVDGPFDEQAKQRLQFAAIAFQRAAARQKEYVPFEATWGVKP